MTAGNYNAKQYTLPFFPDLGLLYIRKDIVSAEDAAKLVSGDYTYADLQTMAETYMGQGGTTDGIVFQAKLYEGLVCNLTEYTAGWTDVEGGLVALKNGGFPGIPRGYPQLLRRLDAQQLHQRRERVRAHWRINGA